MSAQSILIIYILFFFGELIFTRVLIMCNMHEVGNNQNQVPNDFVEHIDLSTYRKSAAYTLSKSKLELISGTIQGLVLFAVIISGVFGHLEAVIPDRHPYIKGLIFIGAVSLFFTLVDLPFSIYGRFSIEKRFGFNRTGWKLFLIDTLKGLLISLLIGIPLLLGLFFFMDKTGSLWWIWGSLFVITLQLLLMVIYPTLIAPLFNKFTPMEENDTRRRLEQLAAELGFKTKGIFVMDGSKRSSHSNAYFTGLGQAKRIVLFDTLIDTLDDEELAAVLAHEIGHEKMNHIKKRVLLSVGFTILSFYILHLLLDYASLFHAFGFDGPSYYGILTILMFCVSPFTFFLTPLFTAWSRKHEYAADRFAVKALNEGSKLINGLITLSKDNLSNLTPHIWYSRFFYSHPALRERIAAIKSVDIA